MHLARLVFISGDAPEWERRELCKRKRSMATVAALVAMNRPDQSRFHLNYAVENGVSKED